MSHRTVYLNGIYVAEEDAKVSIFDRGFLFADGIYEMTCVLESKLVDFEGHTRRLRRSANKVGIKLPLSEQELLKLYRELIHINGITEGAVYLQLTRGNEGDRNFQYSAGTPPTLVVFTQAKLLVENPSASKGISVVTLPDLRWARRDIKTVQLLYPVMAKMTAKASGAADAWMVEDGKVTEGASNNVWILTRDHKLITRELSHSILPGVTRAVVYKIAEELSLDVQEKSFTVAEAQNALECFATSATTFVTPVVVIDDVEIANGQPGPVTLRLRQAYIQESRKRAI